MCDILRNVKLLGILKLQNLEGLKVISGCAQALVELKHESTGLKSKQAKYSLGDQSVLWILCTVPVL